ncbi:ATL7 [Symbiodinium natans]|uniref:ATL7 protein n=1 Tax=Symbiodinium natans TaxID=878477 RepID=A0A812L0T0_9DINO|nr:ATL7 [Symbiodinium natans]
MSGALEAPLLPSARDDRVARLSGARAPAAQPAQPLLAEPPEGGDAEARRAQVSCAGFLLVACLVAITMICREAIQGATKSFYCSADGQHVDSKSPAPLGCVIPLATAALLCNLAVIGGLFCVGRFAWQSGGAASDGDVTELRRASLIADLQVWRGFSAKVLLMAGLTYLVAGPACAGLAKLALIFLATGFITLYATALFFDQEFDQVRMSPRLFRFLVVYILVGLTFTALACGATQRVGGATTKRSSGSRDPGETSGLGASVIGPGDSKYFANVCTALGWQQVAPPRCTIPLDFASGVSLWWAASPVFAVLLPTPRETTAPGSSCRRFLQRWRKHIDGAILLVLVVLLALCYQPCARLAPIAYGNAEMGAWAVSLLTLLRRVSPLGCDGWRGPLSHLQKPPPRQVPAQCSVCLQDLQATEDLCQTACGHEFHRSCLEDWVHSRRWQHPGCPLCRESLAKEDSEQVIAKASLPGPREPLMLMAVDVAIDGGEWGDGQLPEDLEDPEAWLSLLAWLDSGGRLVANLGSLSRGLAPRSAASLDALAEAAEALSLKVWLTRYANSDEEMDGLDPATLRNDCADANLLALVGTEISERAWDAVQQGARPAMMPFS